MTDKTERDALPELPDDRDPVHETPAQMARWRDACGQKHDGPAGNYVPGQFSPTGAQMIRFLPPNTRVNPSPEGASG